MSEVKDGTLPFDEMKAELESYIDLAEDEYVGTIGKLMRCFDYDHLDYSVQYIAARYKVLAVYLYRELDKNRKLYDILDYLLQSRDAAIYEKIRLYKCEV